MKIFLVVIYTEMSLNPADAYSSMNKGRVRNFTYGGAHHNGLVEKGNHHLWALVTMRPWLINTMDVSPVTRHNKPWNTQVETIGRLYEPHFKQDRKSTGAGASASTHTWRTSEFFSQTP